MGHMRSPNYPAVKLRDAIAAARLLWLKEKRTPVQVEVLAKALGYSSISGPVRTKVASLRQYGLLDESPNGVRLSDLAMKIVHSPENSDAYTKAVQVAALSPELFLDLRNTHPDGSEDAIKSYLILERGFSEAGARLAASAYRDAISFANFPEVGYTEHEQEEEPMPEASVAPVAKTPPSVPPPSLAGAPTLGVRQDVFSLAEGPVTIQWPATLSPESFEDLGDWLDIVKRKIGRSVEAPKPFDILNFAKPTT